MSISDKMQQNRNKSLKNRANKAQRELLESLIPAKGSQMEIFHLNDIKFATKSVYGKAKSFFFEHLRRPTKIVFGPGLLSSDLKLQQRTILGSFLRTTFSCTTFWRKNFLEIAFACVRRQSLAGSHILRLSAIKAKMFAAQRKAAGGGAGRKSGLLTVAAVAKLQDSATQLRATLSHHYTWEIYCRF